MAATIMHFGHLRRCWSLFPRLATLLLGGYLDSKSGTAQRKEAPVSISELSRATSQQVVTLPTPAQSQKQLTPL